jgi:mono/diheme cytochrome c family protein
MHFKSPRPPSAPLIALIVGIGLLGACSSNQGGTVTGSTCPTDSALTYEDFGQAFFAANCVSCHSGREEPTLTTLADIQANREEIDMVAAAGPNGVNTAMPENGSVSTAERTELGEWLACGAP